MSEQTRKSRKRQPEGLNEGDQIKILPSSTETAERTASILLKDGSWFLCRLDSAIAWINLRQV